MDTRIQALIGELGKANPCGSAEEAHRLLSSSIEKLDIRGKDGVWVIPLLTSKNVKGYGDGGFALRQIGHQIYINSNGAFGIYEITDEIRRIYTKGSQTGENFNEIEGYRMPY